MRGDDTNIIRSYLQHLLVISIKMALRPHRGENISSHGLVLCKVLHSHQIGVKGRWVNNGWIYLLRVLLLKFILLSVGIWTRLPLVSASSWILLHLKCKFILERCSILIIEKSGPTYTFASAYEVHLERLLITTHICCEHSKWRLCIGECLLLLLLFWASILALEYLWRNHSGGLLDMNKIMRVVWRKGGTCHPILLHCALLSAPVQLHAGKWLCWRQYFLHWS